MGNDKKLNMLHKFHRSHGQSKATFEAADWSSETCGQSSEAVMDLGQKKDASRSYKTAETRSQVVVCSSQDQMKWVKPHDSKKVHFSTSLACTLVVAPKSWK